MLWDALFDRVSEAAGAPADQCKLIFSMLVSFPLASIFVRLPASRPNLAHLFSLVVSTFFLWPFLGLGRGYLHLLISSAVTYVVVASVRSKHMPWIVFVLTMGHLTVIHIYRTLNSIPTSTIEISGSQMVLVMKLTTFAWNVHDGRQKIEDLDEGQKATRLTQLPGPLPFLGYCFFFPSVLVGPSFDYATYNALITKTIYDAPVPDADPTHTKRFKGRTPHGRRRVAYLHLVIGLAFLAIFAVLGARGAYSRILEPTWYTWTLSTRFGFVQFAGFVARTKYYAVWSLSEGACILTGIGFNGYDPKTGRTLWNRVRNINILSIETAESFKVLFDSWNCRTNVWLRDQVYKRLTPKGKKPGSVQSMATFVTSAFWHGVDPGYYLAFVTAGLLSSLGRQLRRYVRPYFLPLGSEGAAKPNSMPRWPFPNLAKRTYDVVGWVMVQINLNYVASAFLLLRADYCITAWSRMYWYSHIIIAVAIGFFQLGGRRWLRKGIPPRVPKSKVPLQVPEVTLSPPSPIAQEDASANATHPTEEDDSNDADLEWVRHDLQSKTKGGVPFDAGLIDDFLEGVETPRAGTPKPKDD
ncbi:Lysophospholipid acyltransferase [Vanrija pseudolonga]|uniref:Lysophospholipid acyltransferase n=1 Tax=Vanrija pseudolonga TaxID=143232 RepID=A0AAF0Y4G9_9TREE|nr:Lysophospholipid acyltransferase [Vanrija pseudolonga]